MRSAGNFALSIVRPLVGSLEIPPELADPWHRLPAAAQDHLRAFLAPPAAGAAGPYRVAAPAPGPSRADAALAAPFLEDLAAGGPRLRAALPGLARRLAALEAGAGPGRAVVARVVSEGAHTAPFFGFLLPTQRRVRFEELHSFALEGDGDGARLAEARVAVDVHAVVRQLVA